MHQEVVRGQHAAPQAAGFTPASGPGWLGEPFPPAALQAMQELQSTGLFPEMPMGLGPLPGGGASGGGGAGGGAGAPGAGLDFGALMGMLGGGAGGMGGFGAPPPPANPEQAYAAQLQQLQDMVGLGPGWAPSSASSERRPWLPSAAIWVCGHAAALGGVLLSIGSLAPDLTHCLPALHSVRPLRSGLLRPRC